jgi:hypothetical protein
MTAAAVVGIVLLTLIGVGVVAATIKFTGVREFMFGLSWLLGLSGAVFAILMMICMVVTGLWPWQDGYWE